MGDVQRFAAMVLPSPPGDGTAFVNLHWMEPGQDGKKYWNGRPYGSFDELEKQLAWWGRQGQKDFYVCMSTQAMAEDKVARSGKPYKKALRLSRNAVALKSIYIDIDVKKKGGYDSTQEALEALGKFVADTGLPRASALVQSGTGGVHVHWSFEQPITPSEWAPLARALANAAKEHGLRCDPQCTVDDVRLMRVPGTLNYKKDPPGHVLLLGLGSSVPIDTIRSALEKYAGEPVQDGPFRVLPGKVPEWVAEANSELGAGMEATGDAPPITIEAVAKHCPLVASELASGGAETPEPLWKLMANLSVFIEDGRGAFHEMSKGHPDYSHRDTDEKYQRAADDQAENDLGWPQCSTFDMFGSEACKTCPLRVMNSSPLRFAAAEAKEERARSTGALPGGYQMLPNNRIARLVPNADGTDDLVEVLPYEVHKAWLSEDPWTIHVQTKVAADRGLSVIDMPFEVGSSQQTFNKHMSGCGFALHDAQYKRGREFLMAWSQTLQQQRDSILSKTAFGWSYIEDESRKDKGSIDGFAYGGKLWMPSGDRNTAGGGQLANIYSPKGSIDAWRELSEVITSQKRPALDAILAVAFAGPLVQFTGHGGLLLNAYSPESGIGKTTTMKVAQAVWGSPTLGMQALNDTSNAVINKMGKLRSLPMFWDELKSKEQTTNFVKIVFDLTGGREKARMNSDITLRRSGTWNTMMVSASNDSILDDMARITGSTTAGLHRMFEYAVPKPGEVSHNPVEIQRLVGKLDYNHGHAGKAYAEFLGRKHNSIDADVADRLVKVASKGNLTQEERHWTATITVLLLGAEYANELGLVDIDIFRLETFLLGVLDRMRSEVKNSTTDLSSSENIAEILQQFLDWARYDGTVVTDKIHRGRGKPPPGTVKVLNNVDRLRAISAHIARDEDMIRINRSAFGEFCEHKNLNHSTLKKKLESSYGLIEHRGLMAPGTGLSSMATFQYEISLLHPKLVGLIGGE
jgi:hypothetical protein